MSRSDAIWRSEAVRVPFDVILLDVGGVLLYDFPVEMAFSYFLYRELRREQPELRLGADDLVWTFRTGSRPPVPQMVWDAAVARAWPLVLERWRELSIPIPAALEALSRLGGRLSIVANQPAATLEVLRELGVDRFVEHIFLDSLVGISKPDPALYRHAASVLGIEPAQTLVIGDRLDNDVRPAQQAGMAVGWIRRFPLDNGLAIPDVPAFWRFEYLQMRPALQLRLEAREGDWWRLTPPDFIFEDLPHVATTLIRRGDHEL